MLNYYPYFEIKRFLSSSEKNKTIIYIMWRQMDDISSFRMSECEFKDTLEKVKVESMISFKYRPVSGEEEMNVNYKKLVLDFFLGSKAEKFFNKDDFIGEEYWTNDPPEFNLSLIKKKANPIEWRPENLYTDTDMYTEIAMAIRRGDLKLPVRLIHPQPLNY